MRAGNDLQRNKELQKLRRLREIELEQQGVDLTEYYAEQERQNKSEWRIFTVVTVSLVIFFILFFF
ncbi:TPA: hypothetical protein ACLQU7_001059 [Bacillus tropicus]|uniref:Uncharacterized protein n=1 Tax=Bacillus tropicus TaxID=2026188 RepID=A0ABD7ZN96_9BACI|nr:MULTISPECIES: hypothetical protein [Bacillus cereus group]EAL16647.1 hypothetical protein protein [Bacillus cereus G9241]MDA1547642.1 hypothetical protein [Bacillus cereus group sp. TH253LC]MDA1581590.1 hypothetical protein [Bacillus cereus group sp. TH228LC]MDA1834515.1 hypothetical protein [Bacillus cereus group sp. BY142LC]QPS52551.1 hypothetical protein I6G54_11080 [Bacillus tropicus]